MKHMQVLKTQDFYVQFYLNYR